MHRCGETTGAKDTSHGMSARRARPLRAARGASVSGAATWLRSPLPADIAALSLFAAAGPAVANQAGSLAEGGIVARERWRHGRSTGTGPACGEHAPCRVASRCAQAMVAAVRRAADVKPGRTMIAGNDIDGFGARRLPAVLPGPACRRSAWGDSPAPGPFATAWRHPWTRTRFLRLSLVRRELRDPSSPVRHDMPRMQPAVRGSVGPLRTGAPICMLRSTRRFRQTLTRGTGGPAARHARTQGRPMPQRKDRAMRHAAFPGRHRPGESCARPLQFGLGLSTHNPARKGEHHGRPADRR